SSGRFPMEEDAKSHCEHQGSRGCHCRRNPPQRVGAAWPELQFLFRTYHFFRTRLQRFLYLLVKPGRDGKPEISLLQQVLNGPLIVHKSPAISEDRQMFFQSCTLHYVNFVINVRAKNSLTVPTQHCGPPCAKLCLF